MRDFRDAKAMAHTMRAALAAKGLNITVSQSLELIAQAFGVADWNTLSAAIRAEAAGPRNNAHSPQLPITATMYRALGYAIQRKHQYETLEHLLLALIDDADASAVMQARNADLGALKAGLLNYLDNELKDIVIEQGADAKPTAAFERVAQRAALYAHGLGRPVVTGENTLLAIFPETRSRAARFLGEQEGVSPKRGANPIARGVGQGR